MATTPRPTESQVATEVLSAINTALSTAVRAYEPSKVPVTRPDEYAVVTIAERVGGQGRGGRYATRGWAVYVMGVSRTSVANARRTLETAHSALEGVVLLIDGIETTPIRLGPTRPVGPDDGWFSGSKSYTLAT